MIKAAFQTLVAEVTLLGTSSKVIPGLLSLFGMLFAELSLKKRSLSGAT